jgi:hypothetical protein
VRDADNINVCNHIEDKQTFAAADHSNHSDHPRLPREGGFETRPYEGQNVVRAGVNYRF